MIDELRFTIELLNNSYAAGSSGRGYHPNDGCRYVEIAIAPPQNSGFFTGPAADSYEQICFSSTREV